MAASYFKRIVARQPAARPLRPLRTVFSAPAAPPESAARPAMAPPALPSAPPVPAAVAPRPPAPPSNMRPERRPPSPSPLVAQQLIRPEYVAVRVAPAPREGTVIRPPQASSVAQAPPRPSASSGVVVRPSAPHAPALVPVPVAPKMAVHAVDATPPSAARPAMPDARPTPLLSLEAATERTREVSPALTAIAQQEPPPAAPQALKPPAASVPPVVAFDARAPEKPATRIEIGAVEVRLAPVESRPRRAAAPAERRGRGFVYPFGFRQG